MQVLKPKSHSGQSQVGLQFTKELLTPLSRLSGNEKTSPCFGNPGWCSQDKKQRICRKIYSRLFFSVDAMSLTLLETQKLVLTTLRVRGVLVISITTQELVNARLNHNSATLLIKQKFWNIKGRFFIRKTNSVSAFFLCLPPFITVTAHGV